MSTSRNFTVRPLTTDEIENRRWHGYTCAAGKCQAQRTRVISFDFLAGRRRVRLQHRDVEVCRQHAEAFAAKHGIEISDEPAPVTDQRSLLEQAGFDTEATR